MHVCFHESWLRRTILGATSLLACATGFIACERLEPAPENDVKFQATGTYTLGTGVERERSDAVLIIRQRQAGYLAEAHDKDSNALLFSAFMTLGSLDIGDQRGPMKTALLDTDHDGVSDKLSVSQSFSVDRPAYAISGPKAGGAILATFHREESRWMWFSAGYLEHGTKGQVDLILKNAQGGEVGRFTGLTTTQPEQTVIGFDVPGTFTQGGAYGGTSQGFAVANLPNGAGSFIFSDPMGGTWRQRFSFDPRKDLAGQDISMKLLIANDEYVEMTTELKDATLTIRHVEIDPTTTASGVAHLGYNLVVAVTQKTILVQGTNNLDAQLTATSGDTSSFAGANAHVDTLLDW